MDFGKIVARIKNVLVIPTSEWPAIAGDTSPAQSIYTGRVRANDRRAETSKRYKAVVRPHPLQARRRAPPA
jgi:hypothetical protein